MGGSLDRRAANPGWWAGRGRLARRVVVLTAAALLPPLTPATAGAATDAGAARFGPSPLATITPAHGRPVPAAPRAQAGPSARWSASQAVWPSAGLAEVAVTSGRETAVRVGGLPVRARVVSGRAAGAVRLRVQTLDQAAARRAGLVGTLIRLSTPDTPAGARVAVTVDYSAFRFAAGGDWTSRLRLMRLPDCALARTAGCAATPLPSTSDVRAGRLTATVDLGAGMATFAVAAASSAGAGDFTATPLAPTASWQVSAQTGGFSWSYPIRVPAVPGDLKPSLAVGYSSDSVDGRTASTNNQPSWLGEGQELWGGYVERGYRSCHDDGVSTSGDLCWAADNATLVLNGRAVHLVRDDTTHAWRPMQDDGSRIEQLTGAVNGARSGEYWKLTTIDGMQYWFGLNQLPGWVSGKPTTNSTWTVPVFGNDAGEPCHNATFAASSCTQAWRWNLDYVVDPHSDAVAYWYAAETNKYGLNNNTSAASYVRGGTLTRIDYGFRAGQAYAATPPAAQVTFTVAERCNTPGSTCTPTPANASNYPDAPLDKLCTGTTCSSAQTSPTFFTTKKLTTITTQVRSATGYTPVDSWAFSQSFPVPGDGSTAALWLDSIVHTGLVGGSVAVPPVTFAGLAMQNRVDGLEGWVPLNKYRVSAIRTETGGQIDVNYAPAECVRTALPPAQDTNTQRCFPVWWSPPSQAPVLDWFHKYVVAQVLERDLVGGGRSTETDYDYRGGGGWHYVDADEVTPVSKRTWSDWRGYAEVHVRTGAGDDGPRTERVHRFYRGMDGDKLTSGTRSATVTDSQGGVHTDSDGLAGFGLETQTLNGVGGPEVSGQIGTPVRTATASHAHDGRTMSAYLVRTASQQGRTALSAGGARRTQVDSQYDSHGNPTVVDDLGDLATAADDRCTRTSYAANTSAWMYSYPSETTTVAVRCSATPAYPRDAISDGRNYYDGSTTLGALPGAGDVTRTDAVKSYTGSTPVFLTTQTSTWDTFGRQLTSTDALNRTSHRSYTETNGLTTQVVSTDPAGFTTTTTLDPVLGLPLTMLDPNARRTDLTHDPLGRLTQVWLPGRAKASYPSAPSRGWTYSLSATAAAAVTASSVGPNGVYVPTYTLYDGLLRPRQTQKAAEDGSGRVITDTTYDTSGRQVRGNAPYVAAGTPGTTLLLVDDNQVPGQTITSYDGASRPTASIFRKYAVEQWRTSTGYGGDHTDLTPPAGGTPTTSYVDARGLQTRLLQYHGSTPTGPADTTTYGYTPAGQLASIQDPAGNAWAYGYDLLGRQTSAADPDKGTTTRVYDDAGQLSSTTDARGTTLAYSYDSLGRKTGEYQNSLTGPQLASWTYDTLAGGKGLPVSATRYANGQAYTTAISGYGSDGRAWGKKVTIPAAETGLAGTYTYRLEYAPDGSLNGLGLPITPGLPNDGLTWRYNDFGNQVSLGAGLTNYVTGASYTPFGQPARITLNNGGATAWLSYYYDLSTGRLTNTKVETGGNPTPASDAHYTYDPAGNVTGIADTPTGGTSDVQCFGYDYLHRLTEAWTPATTDCTAAPTTAGLAGPAPYWQSYRYDLTGNRTSQVTHTAAGDTTSTSAYPAPASPHPHAVQSVTTTGPGVSRTDSYGYDPAGDTTSRTLTGLTQTLGWDAEGRLASTTGSGPASFLYTADGDRLIRRDTSGSTLYLPDGVEVHVDPNGANPTSIRYYQFAGHTIAVRTPAGVTFLGSDRLGTATQTVNGVSGAAATRRYDPYGNPRGSQPPWPGDRGYIGGTTDTATGLTHLGARDYDPTLGRFISVDPVLTPADPQQTNGYTYAQNNPTTASDPTGELCTNGPDGMCRRTNGSLIPTPGVSDRQGLGPISSPPPPVASGQPTPPAYPQGLVPDEYTGAKASVRQDFIHHRLLDLREGIHTEQDATYYQQGTAAYCAEYADPWCGASRKEAATELVELGILVLPWGRLAKGAFKGIQFLTRLTRGGKAAAEAGVEAGVAGSGQVTVLGRFTGGVDAYVGKPGFNTLDLPFKGTGRWYWSRNKAFIDDAIERGDEIRLMTNPNAPLYQGGNVYQRELRYLRDRGYEFQSVDDYWIAVPGR